MPGSDPTPAELAQYDDGHGGNKCRKCGFEYHCSNMYGMGICKHCGWKNTPHMSAADEDASNLHWAHHCHNPDCMISVPLIDDKVEAHIDRNRIRIEVDQVLANLAEGLYDDLLSKIAQAVSDRRKVRQEKALALVQEVYGPNATISTAPLNRDFVRTGPARGSYQ